MCLTACSPSQTTPPKPKPPAGMVSVAYLKSLYSNHPRTVTEDYVISGTVVSSDRHGNFYKVLVIEDDTGGIELKLDVSNLFEIFFPGTCIEVSCNGLTLGGYGGLIQLGTPPAGGYEAGYIAADDMNARITVTGRLPETVRPETITISDISPEYISRYVAFRDIQFVESDIALTWCGDGDDSERTLIDRHGDTLTVWTSPHAGFASQQLPQGSGYIEGILSYFNGSYQFKLIDVLNLDLDRERF